MIVIVRHTDGYSNHKLRGIFLILFFASFRFSIFRFGNFWTDDSLNRRCWIRNLFLEKWCAAQQIVHCTLHHLQLFPLSLTDSWRHWEENHSMFTPKLTQSINTKINIWFQYYFVSRYMYFKWVPNCFPFLAAKKTNKSHMHGLLFLYLVIA